MNRITISLLTGVAALSFFSAAHAADLIVDQPAPPVGIVDVSNTWDGIYVGAFVGGVWGTLTDETAVTPLLTTTTDHSGWEVGVNIGADFTLTDGIVAGIVGDIAWVDSNADGTPVTPLTTFNHKLDWRGSIRGKLGFDGGQFMPYLTAGVAFAHGNATFTDITPTTFTDEQTHVGWTVGAGVEFAVADRVSIDLLYRYTDYGTKDYTLAPPTPTSLHLTSNAITAGVNWRF